VQPRASFPRTTKDKTAYRCTPIIDGKKFFVRTLKCYLWQSWARDPEDSKSKPMVQACERQANREPGRRQRPRQLDNVELDSSNKAEAALQVKASSKPTSVPMLGMSLPRLPFLIGTAVPPRRLKNLRWEQEMGPQETTCENKILFYPTSTYVIRNMPSADVLRNESKRIILLVVWNAIGWEILADFVVKQAKGQTFFKKSLIYFYP
jgi:hypothetical protein